MIKIRVWLPPLVRVLIELIPFGFSLLFVAPVCRSSALQTSAKQNKGCSAVPAVRISPNLGLLKIVILLPIIFVYLIVNNCRRAQFHCSGLSHGTPYGKRGLVMVVALILPTQCVKTFRTITPELAYIELSAGQIQLTTNGMLSKNFCHL